MKKIYNFIFVHIPLHKYQAYATKWPRVKYFIRNLTRYACMAIITASILYIGFTIAHVFYPRTVEATPVTIVKEVIKKSAVMERIADCESGKRDKNGKAIKGSASHLDPLTGQVYTKANENKTVDIGKYMINEYYHGKTATAMGLNLTIEADNEKMAYYIYDTQGTEPWSASRSCWIAK